MGFVEFNEAAKKGKKDGVIIAAEELIAQYSFATLRDTDEILWYHEGAYRRLGETRIREALGEDVRKGDTAEVVEIIKRKTFHNREEFDADPFMLPVNNGLLDLHTFELRPHTPVALNRCKVPRNYSPDSKCPRFEKFLSKVIDDEKQRENLIMFMGYSLLRFMPYQVAAMLLGSGKNGKSTFLEAFSAMLGRENVSNVGLQALDDDRFAAAGLEGKLANVFADVPPVPLRYTTNFKMLVSGDPMMVQNKYERPHTMWNHSKLLFSANELPPTSDKSDAYFCRWIYVVFPNTFEIDDTLLPSLTTPEELDGMLALAVRGLKKLLENHGFDETPIEDVKAVYEAHDDSVTGFVKAACTLGEGLEESTFAVREAYRTFCKKAGVTPMVDNSFGRQLRALYNIENRPVKRPGKIQQRCYKGLKLNVQTL